LSASIATIASANATSAATR